MSEDRIKLEYRGIGGNVISTCLAFYRTTRTQIIVRSKGAEVTNHGERTVYFYGGPRRYRKKDGRRIPYYWLSRTWELAGGEVERINEPK